jgi:hypothetical protein
MESAPSSSSSSSSHPLPRQRRPSTGSEHDNDHLSTVSGGSNSSGTGSRSGSRRPSVSGSSQAGSSLTGTSTLTSFSARGPSRSQRRVADRALVALLQMLIEIKINRRLDPWRVHPDILKRMPDFQIKLGFGLHMGWAVEGALGSDRKIDGTSFVASVLLFPMFGV